MTASEQNPYWHPSLNSFKAMLSAERDLNVYVEQVVKYCSAVGSIAPFKMTESQVKTAIELLFKHYKP